MPSAKVSGVRTNRTGMRAAMRSSGVVAALGNEAERAKYRAESVGGMRFGAGVDYGPVSPHAWVGSSAKRGGPKAVERYIARAAAALAQALHGV